MSKIWLLVLVSFYSGNLLACKCEAYMIKPADKKADYIFSAASNVFLAKVIKSTPLGNSKTDTRSLHYFESVDSFKGNTKTFPYIQTGSTRPTSCDHYGMDVGNYYLVYSEVKYISSCSVMKVDLEIGYYKELLKRLSELRDKKHNQKSVVDAKNAQHN